MVRFVLFWLTALGFAAYFALVLAIWKAGTVIDRIRRWFD